MISKTIYGKGRNNFGRLFDDKEWSAPVMVSPEEIKQLVDSFTLPGRKIKRLKLFHSFIHNRDDIEDEAYRNLEGLSEDERQRQSNYKNLPPQMLFNRHAEISEPFIIEFEDGDRFEVVTPQDPEFRMSMNCIPWNLGSGISGEPNIKADILFSDCIGQTIKNVEVNTYIADKDPMSGDKFDEPPYKRQLVSDIVLRFEYGSGLKISSWYDYCYVECIDANNQTTKIKFFELEKALYNVEDIHNDETISFESGSCLLFFGKKGEEYVKKPCISLRSSENKETYIAFNDFLLLGWSIAHITDKPFSGFSHSCNHAISAEEWWSILAESEKQLSLKYTFSVKTWQDVLAEAERILSFKTFDELFDDFTKCKINNYLIEELNASGAEFWKNRSKYKEILEDVKEWSSLVLKEGDAINILGF